LIPGAQNRGREKAPTRTWPVNIGWGGGPSSEKIASMGGRVGRKGGQYEGGHVKKSDGARVSKPSPHNGDGGRSREKIRTSSVQGRERNSKKRG